MTLPTVDLKTQPDVAAFFDEASNTLSYVVKDPDGRSADL